jgi:hypothetical protein
MRDASPDSFDQFRARMGDLSQKLRSKDEGARRMRAGETKAWRGLLGGLALASVVLVALSVQVRLERPFVFRVFQKTAGHLLVEGGGAGGGGGGGGGEGGGHAHNREEWRQQKSKCNSGRIFQAELIRVAR